MMEVLYSLGPVRIVDRDAGTVEIEMPIPAVGLPPTLSKLLRIAVRNDLAVPLAGRPGHIGARGHAHRGGHPLDDPADSKAPANARAAALPARRRSLFAELRVSAGVTSRPRS
jgi:hypothetical protein